MKLTYIDFDNFIIENKNKSNTVDSYSTHKKCVRVSFEVDRNEVVFSSLKRSE